MIIIIPFSSSNNQLRIPNFCNNFFVYLLFEYFYKITVLNQYHNTSKNANIILYIKEIKTLCNTLNRGNWNSGFVKLVVWWAERDIHFTALWKETTPRKIKNRKSSFQNNLFFQERCTKYFLMGVVFSPVIYLLPVDQLSKRIKSKSTIKIPL